MLSVRCFSQVMYIQRFEYFIKLVQQLCMIVCCSYDHLHNAMPPESNRLITGEHNFEVGNSCPGFASDPGRYLKVRCVRFAATQGWWMEGAFADREIDT